MKKKKFLNFAGFLHIVPIIWAILFVIIPILIAFKISFSFPSLSIPPYSNIMTFTKNLFTLKLNLENYTRLFSDSFYISSFIKSIYVASFSTFLCLLIGYPIAFNISKAKNSVILLIFLLIPFFTPFLIRVYGWINLLGYNGKINSFLQFFGVINEPLNLLDNDYAICVGLVYCYLPFMILPIFSSLTKIDKTLIEASYDLGATRTKTFWKVIFPLSKHGVIGGCTMVFLPTIGEFVIPELLGGGKNIMIGRLIWSEFFFNKDWPFACTISIVILLMFAIIQNILLKNSKIREFLR